MCEPARVIRVGEGKRYQIRLTNNYFGFDCIGRAAAFMRRWADHDVEHLA